MSAFALAYPFKPWQWKKRRDDPGSPGFTNPEWVRQAKRHGRTVWQYSNSNEETVRRAARLGVEFFMNNGLAYKGQRLTRDALYKLHQYEGAAKPTVECITRKVEARAAKPVIVVRFDQPMEARSVNYNSVRLTRAPSRAPSPLLPSSRCPRASIGSRSAMARSP